MSFNVSNVSATDLDNTKSTEAPCQLLYPSGPVTMRPRVGFNPIKPLKLAGILIEPPPSPAVAIGTNPAFTAAPDPPDDPPDESPWPIGEYV